MNSRHLVPLGVTLALFAAACSSDTDPTSSVDDGAPTTVTAPADSLAAPPAEEITLVAYDSFPDADTSLNEALATFTDQTGIAVDILIAGDTGTMLSKASLTVGNPEGDVMFGIDNTYLFARPRRRRLRAAG